MRAGVGEPDGLADIRRRLDEQGRRIAELEAENRGLRDAVARLQASLPVAVSNVVLAVRPASVFPSAPADKVAAMIKPLTARGVQLSPYGYVKLDLIHNTQKTDGDDYSFYVRPPWEEGAGRGETTISLRESRIGLDLAVPGSENGLTVSGKLEVDFYSGTVDNPALRIRHAYLTAEEARGWSVLAGQTFDACWVAGPKMLDGAWAGGTGHPYARRPQLRLSKTLTAESGTRLTARVAAAQNAGSDLDRNSADDGSASGLPLIQSALILEKRLLAERNSTLALSGSYGRERVDAAPDPVADGVYDESLIMLTAVLPLVRMAKLSGALFAGENMDTYKAGILQGINMTRGVCISGRGGWVQGTFEPDEAWQLHVGTACEDVDDADLELRDRTLNTRCYANAFYDLTRHVRLAAEYARLMTEFAGAGAAHDDRFDLAIYCLF